jgi:hypothetical protein
MRVFVTGASGWIGSATAYTRELLSWNRCGGATLVKDILGGAYADN